MKPCAAPGCTRLAIGFSQYCSSHKSRDRRHGHPLQTTISATRLKRHIDTIKHFIDRHPERDAWAKLEKVWKSLVDMAEAEVRAFEAGAVAFTWQIEACRDIIKVSKDVEPRRVVEVVVGFAMMMKREPGAFRSDRAAWISLARRFRVLTDRNVGTYWNKKAGKLTRVYRDASPRASEWLGRQLMITLGIAGGRIAALMDQAAAERDRAGKEAWESLGGQVGQRDDQP
jgi:hypothetical protein